MEAYELTRELRRLNDEWQEVTERRKAFMDEHMADFAEHPVGAEIFDGVTGKRLGIIVEHYRLHADDPRYDSMDIYYRFDNGLNTSSERASPVTREQLARILERRAKSLMDP
jgi:hypothetical protein